MRRHYFVIFMLLAVVPAESGMSPPSPVAATASIQEDGAMFGPQKPPPPMSAKQAVEFALADAERIAPHDRRYVRYIWCPDGQFKSANLALNIVSRGATPIRAVPILSDKQGFQQRMGGGVLVRVDARNYARFFSDNRSGVNQDVEEFLKYWEFLKYDPTFNLLVTKDNAQFAEGELPNKPKKPKRVLKDTIRTKKPCDPYVGSDGRTYDYLIEEEDIYEEVEIKDGEDSGRDKHAFAVLRLNPDYLSGLGKLQGMLYTEAPITLDRYFMARVLHTVKRDPAIKSDDAVFETIWGGLYYEFRGIKRSQQQGVTDEDLFLQGFGIENAQKLFDRLQTDQRTAIYRSGVTGRQRRVDFFNTPSGHAWDVMGVGSVTHDLRAEDIDVATHPLMNLLTFKDAAREDIFVGPNGMHVYAIFDGNGKLLDEAAINVVSDRTIPNPHPPRLQCAMSCIACHDTEGSDGWKTVGNDVKKLLSNRRDPQTGRQLLDLDIVYDATQKDQIGVMNRLAGLYAGDFTKGMRRSRDDYAETILKASGPQGEDQTVIVKTAMSKVVNSTRSYIYDDVTPRQACWELGVEPGNDPAETLRKLLPPEPSKLGFAPEDPRVHALKKNVPIPRTDFSFVQSYMASRIAKQKAGGK